VQSWKDDTQGIHGGLTNQPVGFTHWKLVNFTNHGDNVEFMEVLGKSLNHGWGMQTRGPQADEAWKNRCEIAGAALVDVPVLTPPEISDETQM